MTRALSALLLALLAAFALAPPVPVLTLTDGTRRIMVQVGEGETFTYSYTSSVYNAPVEERHVREGSALTIASAASTDIRAVEYFRWEGEPRPTGGEYVQAAPANKSPRLLIRVTPQYRQRLSGATWTVDLAERFGDSAVRVVPRRVPMLLVLLYSWRP